MKTFSLSSFAIGLIAGLVVGGGGVVGWMVYAATVPSSSLPGTQILQNAIHTYVEAQQRVAQTIVYGKVTQANEGTLTLEAAGGSSGQPVSYTFRFDSTTNIYKYSNDAMPTPIALTVSDIQAGDMVSVRTNEPLGSVADQHAVEVIKQ